MLLLLHVLSCIPAPPKSDSPVTTDSNSETVTSDSHDSGDAGDSEDTSTTDTESQPECVHNEDCDDKIDCTQDICDASGNCSNAADNNLCSTDVTCMESVCNPSTGCEEQFAKQGSSCDADTCSSGDVCDGAGVCEEGGGSDADGATCSAELPCSASGECAGGAHGEWCECSCPDGQLKAEVQGIIADSNTHPTRNAPLKIQLADGTQSGWISCPADIQAFISANSPLPTGNSSVTWRYNCNPNDSFSQWYQNRLDKGSDARSGSILVINAGNKETDRLTFYEAEPVSLTPYNALSQSSYTDCVDYVEFQILTPKLE